jgi:hypothetical protein
MSILIKIRQRPDNEKKIISLVSAGVITLIILIVWISFSGFKEDLNTEQVAMEDKTLSSISPVEVIKEEFGKAISNFKQITASSTIDISTSSGQATSTN